MFDMLKFPEHRLVVQANGPIPKSLYEKAAREYAKWWGVPLEARAAEASSTDLDEATLRLEEEKGFVREGKVCEMESSSSERGIHTIVNGHPTATELYHATGLLGQRMTGRREPPRGRPWGRRSP